MMGLCRMWHCSSWEGDRCSILKSTEQDSPQAMKWHFVSFISSRTWTSRCQSWLFQSESFVVAMFMLLLPKPGNSTATTENPLPNSGLKNFAHVQEVVVLPCQGWRSPTARHFRVMRPKSGSGCHTVRTEIWKVSLMLKQTSCVARLACRNFRSFSLKSSPQSTDRSDGSSVYEKISPPMCFISRLRTMLFRDGAGAQRSRA
mmetsp:Transcript_23232/g.64971  ORF Transcript_23232/g.64971 Transcript_23232/m.64971 type:complete len:202 (+) Transcript_23232:1212-1817(+)